MKKLMFVFLILLTANARAYFLPPSYFFQSYASQNKAQQNILIKQDRSLISQGAVSQTNPETIKIKRPGLFKWTSDVVAFEAMKVLGKTKATTGTPTSQRIVPITTVLTPLDILYMHVQGSRIEAALGQLHVDVSQTKLELVQKVIEIRVGDPKGNRLYFSPDSGALDAMVYDDRLYLFKYVADKFLGYPSETEIYESGTLKEKIRTKTVIANTKISDAEFEVK